MNNFVFQNPTMIIYGDNQIETLNKYIPQDARVMILYGGGSIHRNGVYASVVKALEGYSYCEFGGIPANPTYEKLLEALAAIKSFGANFLLAVGGGSVIDGTKFLAAAAAFDGEDPWMMLKNRKLIPSNPLPFGTVLTLPATGSEMNSGAVISREQTHEKFAMGSPKLFPRFSVIDPIVCKTLPKRQIVNGVVDAFIHVMEQYMTAPSSAGHTPLQDRFSESIMKTLIEVGPKVVQNPEDKEAVGSFMWSCTLALNGLIAAGVAQDWATHMIGHELTALIGIDHARSLAVISPRLLAVIMPTRKEKMAHWAKVVWEVNDESLTEEARALEGVRRMEKFFQSLEVATHLVAYVDNDKEKAQEVADEIRRRFEERKWSLGDLRDLSPEICHSIILQSI